MSWNREISISDELFQRKFTNDVLAISWLVTRQEIETQGLPDMQSSDGAIILP